MDLMNIRRGLMSMAQGAKIYSGTYIPETDNARPVVDTGATGWTHFLIVAHTLPYEEPLIRCAGARYVDFGQRYAVYTFGSSAVTGTPSQATTHTDTTSVLFGNVVEVSGSVITFKGSVAGNGGQFQAGTPYDWYAW